MDLNMLSERFSAFAERECRNSSNLYEHLARNIANDTKLLQLAARSKPGQPVPNLLLGAVHYLLLQGKEHELMEYYASIVDHPRHPAEAILCFRDFCNKYETDIIQLLETKLVQTNEVRRCTYLYPSFCHIHKITGKPLAIIEIGTSAGLQLLWDKYCYSYNSNEMFGNEQSALKLTSEIRGEGTPILSRQSPPVLSRIGMDLHVNDLSNPADFLWLKSLIWPEHKERISFFEKATLCLEKHPLELIEGDGVLLLPQVVSKITEDAAICIFHTHVANQIPHESKIKLCEDIQTLGKERDVFHLYNNIWDVDLHLDYYVNGNEYREKLAVTDGHGRWFRWLL